jgi:hypothetical protein
MYMTWLDGQGYRRFGTRGLLGTDALSNLVAAGLVLFLIARKSAMNTTREKAVEGEDSSSYRDQRAS